MIKSTIENDIEKRKREHLEMVLRPECRRPNDALSKIALPYDALFENAGRLKTSVTIAGKSIAFPLMFGAMTGGHAHACAFNDTLRRLAARYRLAMTLGSMRAALVDETLIGTYGRGDVEALFANIGAAQIGTFGVRRIAETAKKMGACGLTIHLNGLQEWVQPENRAPFCVDYDALARFCEHFPMPVYIKEVGSGIGGKCAHRLASLNISGIETASRGGTSWVSVEALRRSKPLGAGVVASLNALGYDIVQSIRDCRLALGTTRTLVASGGIETPLDIVKTLYLGADVAAIAQPLYAAYANGGEDGVDAQVREWMEVARLIWASTGASDLPSLQALSRYPQGCV